MKRPEEKIYDLNKLVTINIDGYDGIGKSTLIRKYLKALSNKGIDINTLHYPNYNGTSGSLIKKILNGKYNSKNFSEKELVEGNMLTCAFILDRWFTEREVFEKDKINRNDSKIMLYDRSKFSNLIYYICRKCISNNNYSTIFMLDLYDNYMKTIMTLEPDSRSPIEINIIISKDKSYIKKKDEIEQMIPIELYNKVISLFSAQNEIKRIDEDHNDFFKRSGKSLRYMNIPTMKDRVDLKYGVMRLHMPEISNESEWLDTINALHSAIVLEIKAQINVLNEDIDFNPIDTFINLTSL